MVYNDVNRKNFLGSFSNWGPNFITSGCLFPLLSRLYF